MDTYEIISSKKFKLTQGQKPQKGFFLWITRWLWSYKPNGKKWQIITIYGIWSVISFITSSLDAIIAISIGISILLWKIIKGIAKVLESVGEKIFSKLIFPFVKTLLIIISIISLIIILIYRFSEIKNLILKLYDTII